MGLFSVFKDDKQEYEKINDTVQGSIFHTIEYNLEGILNKINKIDDLDNSEIYDIIKRQHQMILNYDLFLSGDTRGAAQQLFTSKRFLRCFLDVVRLLELSQHEKICINKLAYDYYILPDNSKDFEVVNMLYRLTTEINGKEVVVLSGILGMQGAQILSMIKNSSFKEEKCVHRTNTFLIKFCHDISVQQIVNIYLSLFERFTPVFIYSMMESNEGLSKEEKDVYDKISSALVTVLKFLPSEDIAKVLTDYAYVVNMAVVNTPIRFSMAGITDKRIYKIMRELTVSGVKIP